MKLTKDDVGEIVHIDGYGKKPATQYIRLNRLRELVKDLKHQLWLEDFCPHDHNIMMSKIKDLFGEVLE